MFEQQDASCRLLGLQTAKINQESICHRLSASITPATNINGYSTITATASFTGTGNIFNLLLL